MGGRPTLKNELGNIVALVYRGMIVCTGVLVHPEIVLTAAHCFHNPQYEEFKPEYLEIYTGNGHAQGRLKNDPDGDNSRSIVGFGMIPQPLNEIDETEFFPVLEYWEHPSFSMESKEQLTQDGLKVTEESPEGYDIAIIKLRRSVDTFEPFPIVSGENEIETALVPGKSVLIAGYGQQWDTPGQDPLRMGRLIRGQKFQTITQIRQPYKNGVINVGDLNHHAQHGDSGGGGMVEIDGKYKVFGVVSCYDIATNESIHERIDHQVTYTLIYPHLEWIREKTALDLN